ncbi:hypothetical protein Tco_1407109 [Tanacetum coccineum]
MINYEKLDAMMYISAMSYHLRRNFIIATFILNTIAVVSDRLLTYEYGDVANIRPKLLEHFMESLPLLGANNGKCAYCKKARWQEGLVPRPFNWLGYWLFTFAVSFRNFSGSEDYRKKLATTCIGDFATVFIPIIIRRLYTVQGGFGLARRVHIRLL